MIEHGEPRPQPVELPIPTARLATRVKRGHIPCFTRNRTDPTGRHIPNSQSVTRAILLFKETLRVERASRDRCNAGKDRQGD
jgi:hypothetical protein